MVDEAEVMNMGESYKIDKVPIIYKLYFFFGGMIVFYPIMLLVENFINVPVFVKFPVYIIFGVVFYFFVIAMINRFILKKL